MYRLFLGSVYIINYTLLLLPISSNLILLKVWNDRFNKRQTQESTEGYSKCIVQVWEKDWYIVEHMLVPKLIYRNGS